MKTIIHIQYHVDCLPHFRFLKWERQEGVEQWRIVPYLDGLPPSLRFGDASRQVKVNVLRELQSRSEEELSALMPSILDKAFKGEL